MLLPAAAYKKLAQPTVTEYKPHASCGGGGGGGGGGSDSWFSRFHGASPIYIYIQSATPQSRIATAGLRLDVAKSDDSRTFGARELVS